MDTNIMSVGIDIGTTTISMVVSRLSFMNTSMSYMVPKVEITNKEIIYKSKLYLTPLLNGDTLDGDEIKKIIQKEYKNAKITPEEVDSGAVIITGESALKKNADIIVDKLSSFAGEFVVATAGPDLESIISGKGAGAEDYSKDHSCTIVNMDIGGGTTNISVFSCGEIVGYTCIDLGGRLIRYDQAGIVTYVSSRLKELMEQKSLYIEKGMKLTNEIMTTITDLMAEVLMGSISSTPNKLCKMMVSPNSKLLNIKYPIEYISLSGGIADCYYNDESKIEKYGDLGVALALSLKKSKITEIFQVVESKETIRATVVGAGIYTTVVSGSTISYSKDLFPLKSIPAFIAGINAEKAAFAGRSDVLQEELEWFFKQCAENKVAICIKGKKKITYEELGNMAAAIIEMDSKILGRDIPLIVITENDMAKSLGQAIEQRMKEKKDVICLDKIYVGSGDYIDIGKPLLNGLTVPVVVKTLVFK